MYAKVCSVMGSRGLKWFTYLDVCRISVATTESAHNLAREVILLVVWMVSQPTCYSFWPGYAWRHRIATGANSACKPGAIDLPDLWPLKTRYPYYTICTTSYLRSDRIELYIFYLPLGSTSLPHALIYGRSTAAHVEMDTK
jgi:hypothetical protein